MGSRFDCADPGRNRSRFQPCLLGICQATFVDAIGEECCRDRAESEAEFVAENAYPLDLRAPASMLGANVRQLFPQTMRQRSQISPPAKRPGG